MFPTGGPVGEHGPDLSHHPHQLGQAGKRLNQHLDWAEGAKDLQQSLCRDQKEGSAWK